MSKTKTKTKKKATPEIIVVQAPPVQKPMINPNAVRGAVSPRIPSPAGTPPPRVTPPSAGMSSSPRSMPMAVPPSYKKGGKVQKTGMALVHKGETVKTEKQENARMKKGGKC